MPLLPTLSLAWVLTTALQPATDVTERPPAPREAHCRSALSSRLAWTTLGALFGGLVGYTAVSRAHGDRPMPYVGPGLVIGGGLGFGADSVCP